MSQAKLFAHSLQTEFHKRSSVARLWEVDQFRALREAFGALKPRFKVEEYHGARRQVYFNTSQPWLRTRARCELCDLLIISYSPAPVAQVRLMLLQAKLSRESHPGLCSPTGAFHSSTQFVANFEQWDLLSSRPRLDPTGVFAPPPDLLHSAIVPSVGAFGVFHVTGRGNVDMFYASADTLQPVGHPSKRYGKLATAATAPIRHFGSYADVPACCCLATFGEALFELKLGTPVVSTRAADPVVFFVKSVLATYLREAGADSLLAREIASLVGPLPEAAPSGDSLPSLVLLQGAAVSTDA